MNHPPFAYDVPTEIEALATIEMIISNLPTRSYIYSSLVLEKFRLTHPKSPIPTTNLIRMIEQSAAGRGLSLCHDILPIGHEFR